MHMKGRIRPGLILAAAGVGGLLLSGCGKRTIKHIAFVDNNLTKNAEFNRAVYDGVEAFSGASGVEVTRVQPESASLSDIERSIETAVEEGADTIVCYGQEMGRAVYDMQRMERRIRFLLVDGIPDDGTSGRSTIRRNTTCINPAEEQAGFLAGYAAAAEGWTNLAVLGGAADAPGRRQISGFVQGAEQAASDMMLSGVRVTVRYLGENTASPSLLTETENRFRDGLQLVYGFESGPEFLAAAAAADTGGSVIVYGGTEADVPEDAIAASVRFDFGAAVASALEQEREGTLRGGKTVTLAAEDGGAVLEMRPGAFRSFSQEQYRSLVQRIASGEVQITAEDVTDSEHAGFPITHVQLEIEG